MSFIQFKEAIIVGKDGFLRTAIDQTPSRSVNSISTYQPPRLRFTTDKTKTLGYKVFYAYPYESGDDITNLLKSIKGSGPAKLNKPKLDIFLDKTAEYVAKTLATLNIEIIAVPKSSSILAQMFAYKMGKHLNVEVVYETFHKTKYAIPENKEEAIEYIINNFIDLKLFRASYVSTNENETKKELRKLALTILNSIKKRGDLKLKDVNKRMAKYVANFLKPSVHAEYKFLYKKVLVIDDSFSSGGTMMEMFRILMEQLGASDVLGAVIFKHVTRTN